MNLVKKAAATAAAVAAIAGAAIVAAPAANATDLVNCGSRSDFYETIKTNNNYFCFANYGDISVTVFDTITLSTGNNDGYITYSSGGGSYNSTYRGHWFVGSFPSAVTTTAVHLR